jgi:tetratricopeptide (TPR) repeat protein
LGVSRGQLKGLAELCDRLAIAYEQQRDANFAKNDRQGLVDSFMACYCRYVKAQVLALAHDYPDAEAAIEEARSYRKLHTETSAKSVIPIWQELEAVSTGLILEEQGKLEEAKAAYLQAPESAKATGRLAILELSRNKIDAAKSWALIHANDPTSQYALAQISAKQGRPVPALQEVNRALGHLQKELATGSEYMPAYFSELPDMMKLRAKLQKLIPPPPKPAPPAQKPNAPPPAGSTPKPATPAVASPAASSTPAPTDTAKAPSPKAANSKAPSPTPPSAPAPAPAD